MADELYQRYCSLYFQHTHHDIWDVVGYLRHCSKLRPIDFNLAISFWHRHLRKVVKSPDRNAAIRAETLVKRYTEKVLIYPMFLYFSDCSLPSHTPEYVLRV